MNRTIHQRAEQSARVAAARLLPRLLLRGMLIVLGCEALQAAVVVAVGYPHDFLETMLGWTVLTFVGLPTLYFSSQKPIVEAVAQEVFRHSNARFESIAAQVRDGILLYDLQGKIVYCNPAAERIHAAPPGSLIGQSLESIMPSELRAAFREDLALFRKTGAGTVIGKGTAEVEGLRRDGQRVALEISTAPLAGDQNLIVVVLRDISARKRMDAEITRLARFPSLNPSPILECAADGSIVYSNPGARKLLGAIPSAASMRDLIPDFAPLAQRCLRAEAPLTGIETTVRNGVLLWMLHPSGEDQHVLAYGVDITERKHAEQAFVESERQVMDLLDSLPVGVRVVADEKTVFANAAAARLYGFTSARSLLGLDAVNLVVQKDVARVREYHRLRISGERAPQQYEVTIRRVDGAELPIEVTAKRFYYGGKPASLLVLRDLSTQKRLQLYEQILPVCCMCGQIRDDSGGKLGEGAWGRLDHYVMRHSDTQLSHTFCPPCLEKYRKEQGLAVT